MGALRRDGQRFALDIRFNHAVMYTEEIPGAKQADPAHAGKNRPPDCSLYLLSLRLLLLLNLVLKLLFALLFDAFLAHARTSLYV